MKNREGQKYIIKLYEAQWDQTHDESVKPFFKQLKREVTDFGHDGLFSYYVFSGSESLESALNYKLDTGAEGRLKIGYFAVHGEKDKIQALHSIGRVKLRNMLIKTTSFDGLFFGACDFVNRKTAELLLNGIPSLKWIAGYSNWTPWLEGTFCDIMFFKMLMTGRFVRPKSRVVITKFEKPEDVAMEMYKTFPMALDLKFSLFYRGSNGIISIFEEYEKRLTCQNG
jgi:hypothetical protein